MPRTTLLSSITLAFACVCISATAGAQTTTSVDSVPTDSTLQVRALPAVHVVAAKQKVSRQGVLALAQENRRLAAELWRQDRKIDSLNRRMAYLRGPVTDSMHRDISRLDAQTAETRARRQALEARLQALEGTSASIAP